MKPKQQASPKTIMYVIGGMAAMSIFGLLINIFGHNSLPNSTPFVSGAYGIFIFLAQLAGGIALLVAIGAVGYIKVKKVHATLIAGLCGALLCGAVSEFFAGFQKDASGSIITSISYGPAAYLSDLFGFASGFAILYILIGIWQIAHYNFRRGYDRSS